MASAPRTVTPVLVRMPFVTWVSMAFTPPSASRPKVLSRNAERSASFMRLSAGARSPRMSRKLRNRCCESVTATPMPRSFCCTSGSAIRSIDTATAVDARSTPGMTFFTRPRAMSVSDSDWFRAWAPREAVPSASGSSLALRANTLTACSIRSTEMEAWSAPIPNAFIAWEASPAACWGESSPREPAARSSTGMRSCIDSCALNPAWASSRSPIVASVGENWVAMPAWMAASRSCSSSWALAPDTAATAAIDCSNFPAALASENAAPRVAAPAVNTASPTPSCWNDVWSRSVPSPTRWSRLMKFRSRLRIAPDARSLAVNTNPKPRLFIMGQRPPRRGVRAAFSSSLASRARCSPMRSMSQSRSVVGSSSASPSGATSPDPPCCCQQSWKRLSRQPSSVTPGKSCSGPSASPSGPCRAGRTPCRKGARPPG